MGVYKSFYFRHSIVVSTMSFVQQLFMSQDLNNSSLSISQRGQIMSSEEVQSAGPISQVGDIIRALQNRVSDYIKQNEQFTKGAPIPDAVMKESMYLYTVQNVLYNLGLKIGVLSQDGSSEEQYLQLQKLFEEQDFQYPTEISVQDSVDATITRLRVGFIEGLKGRRTDQIDISRLL